MPDDIQQLLADSLAKEAAAEPPQMRAPTWKERVSGVGQSVYESLAEQPAARLLDLLGMSDIGGVAESFRAPTEVSRGEMPGPPEVKNILKKIRAYHGSPRQHPELQPGSMMTTEPAWAAGYATKMKGGIGPEEFAGKVHGADVELPERVLTAKSLHAAESELLKHAHQALGRPAKTLREAADVVRDKLGYQAIVAKDASGKVTGVIPLTPTAVSEHLDPRQLVEEAVKSGKSVAGNLIEILKRTGVAGALAAGYSADQIRQAQTAGGEQ